MDPLFVGIDLAWSERNRSGGAILQGERLLTTSGTLGSDDEILQFVSPYLSAGQSAVVAVDAPLRVPNATGSRPCDRAVTSEWGRYEAGALPANRRLLGRDNVIRGEALVTRFVNRLGFVESTEVVSKQDTRLICEVYPHPAHVSLFDLNKTLKYKNRGKGRTYESRWAEFRRYQALLYSLRMATPALTGAEMLLVETQIDGMRGKALQEVEEQLDALTCAYIASYLWHYGPARTEVYGTLEEGHILVPLLK